LTVKEILARGVFFVRYKKKRNKTKFMFINKTKI